MIEFRDFQGLTLKGKRVGSRAPDPMNEFASKAEDARHGKCRVYWGMHSCDRRRRHLEYDHKCACGCQPEEWSVTWGEDMSPEEWCEIPSRQKRLTAIESWLSKHDVFDKNGNYRGPKDETVSQV